VLLKKSTIKRPLNSIAKQKSRKWGALNGEPENGGLKNAGPTTLAENAGPNN